METNSVPISTFMIAYFVNRDSKVTLDKIARYCADANMNPEMYLHRVINEYVDSRYEITELKQENDRLNKALVRKRFPFWKRILFKGAGR